jgi:hypothetical protein
MSAQSFAVGRNIEMEPEIVRPTHLQGDEFALQLRCNHPGRRFEGNFFERPGSPIGEASETARAVPAHFRFAAIGIVVTHPEISAVCRRLEDEDAIRPDAAVPIAEPGDLGASEREVAGAIIEQDKVVARPVHFRERQHAICWLAYSVMKAKPASVGPCPNAYFLY